MRKTLKKYLIPHKENSYHPHILHTKRAIFYGLIFALSKIVVVVFVILLPVEVFVLPDVLAEEQRQIVILTNEVRINKGLSTLAVSTKLNTSAQNKANDMAEKEYFAHVQNDQTTGSWLKSAGYKYETAGENLAVGYATAKDIVNAWKNSPTHYANLIDTDFIDLGIGLTGGVYDNHPTVFVVQHLASPLYFDENVKKTTEVSLEPKPKEDVIQKSTEIEANAVETKKPESNNVMTSVLSAKVGKVVSTAAPVMDIKAPTPINKYIKAKSVLSPLTNIFEVSKNIYFGFTCFFIFILLLNVFIEIRKQHPHVILQTSCLIVLLVSLWKF